MTIITGTELMQQGMRDRSFYSATTDFSIHPEKIGPAIADMEADFIGLEDLVGYDEATVLNLALAIKNIGNAVGFYTPISVTDDILGSFITTVSDLFVRLINCIEGEDLGVNGPETILHYLLHDLSIAPDSDKLWIKQVIAVAVYKFKNFKNANVFDQELFQEAVEACA